MPTQKIAVSFDINVDVENLDKLRAEFDKLMPGSAKREVIFNAVKQRHINALAELDGSFAAYKVIAKKKLEEIFKL